MQCNGACEGCQPLARLYTLHDQNLCGASLKQPAVRGMSCKCRPVCLLSIFVPQMSPVGAAQLPMRGQVKCMSNAANLSSICGRRYFTERLVRACAELPKMCQFFHIPFQSGSDEILREMKCAPLCVTLHWKPTFSIAVAVQSYYKRFARQPLPHLKPAPLHGAPSYPHDQYK